jgi:hypothetical protein
MQSYHLAVLTRRVLTLYKGHGDKEEEVNSYLLTLKENKILELERGGAISNSVANSSWKGL